MTDRGTKVGVDVLRVLVGLLAEACEYLADRLGSVLEFDGPVAVLVDELGAGSGVLVSVEAAVEAVELHQQCLSRRRV